MKGNPVNNRHRDDVVDFDALVEEHGNYLLRFAISRVGNEQQAEELVQEAFLGAVRSKDSFKGDSSVRTWLTSILKHKILDWLRKKSRRKELSFEDLGADETNAFFDETGHWASGAVQWSLDPAQKLEQHEMLQTLQTCITGLPEKLRTVFYLREVDGLSTEEIQDTLNISANNSWVILYRARMKLRDCMEKRWFKEDGY